MSPREIKRRMQLKKLTQEKFAERLGVSQTSIHLLIYGQLKSRDLTRRFARALGMTVAEYYGENGREKGAA